MLGRRDGMGPRELLATAAWFGLTAGFLELLLLVVRVELQEKGFFLRSRHFVWMVPASDLLLLLAVGVLVRRSGLEVLGPIELPGDAGELPVHDRPLPAHAGARLALDHLRVARRRARRRAPRHGLRVGPRACGGWCIEVFRSCSGLWSALAATTFVGDARARVWRRGDREAAAGRDLSVLLIVLDTVRADHLSVYGYDRDTTPNLKRLADRGVRFDHARAAASWTLPSHANMFTARWPTELGVERLGWLDGGSPTLAEHLRDSGYATGGFVANPFFCGHESGLSRGFQVYADYPITLGEVFRSSSVGWFLTRAALRVRSLAGGWLPVGSVRDVDLDFSRKDAATVNREFLDWLSKTGPKPFFAFLNYFDAHDPYIPPPGQASRFTPAPLSSGASQMLRDWQRIDKKTLGPDEVRIARDAYDDCLAALDQGIGALLDALRDRGTLDQTLLILTSDHGEQFGEHGDFGHGLSLHSEEVHVPLLISLPGRVPEGRIVTRTVSLRDLPATVLDVLGLAENSPFPGASLATTWRAPRAEPSPATSPPFSELRGPVDEREVKKHVNDGKSLKAVVAQRHAYIRHGDGREQLYDLEADPGETSDVAGNEAYAKTLDACRNALNEVLSTLKPSATR